MNGKSIANTGVGDRFPVHGFSESAVEREWRPEPAADHWLARGTSSCGLVVASGRTHPASLWTEADAESRAATHATAVPPRMPGLPGLLWGVRPLLHHGIQ